MPRQFITPRPCLACGTEFRPCKNADAGKFCSRACYFAHKRAQPGDDRFWAKVRKTDTCWVWEGARQYTGYGRCYWKGRVRGAHEIAYELTHGPIPPGKQVMHSCDHPWCVNPAHLRAGTQVDNEADKFARGRRPTRWTPDDIRAMRQLHGSGTSQSEVARRFGTTQGAIHRILMYTAWTHVT